MVSAYAIFCVGFCLCVVGIVLYLKHEDNDYNRVLRVFGETKQEVQKCIDKTEAYESRMKEIERIVGEISTGHLGLVSSCNENIHRWNEEMEIMRGRQHKFERQISSITRTVNFTFSGPVPVQFIEKSAKPKQKVELLRRSGIKRRNKEMSQ